MEKHDVIYLCGHKGVAALFGKAWDIPIDCKPLKELQEKLGLSYLFISHDLDVVRWFCDEIAVMEEGKFVETGRTEDVIGHPKAEFTKKLVENFILE